MNHSMTKEDILIEALPYLQRYDGKTFVIKYGGAVMSDEGLKDTFAKDVTLLRKTGINIVIVHGGGKEVTQLAEQLGIEARFVGGHRFTSPEMLELVVMSLGPRRRRRRRRDRCRSRPHKGKEVHAARQGYWRGW
jgi:hypothetical protein